MIPLTLLALACTDESLIANIHAAHLSGNDFLSLEETRLLKEDARFQNQKIYELIDEFVTALADDDLNAVEKQSLAQKIDGIDDSGKMRAEFASLDWHHAWTRQALGRFDDVWIPGYSGAPGVDEECEIFRVLTAKVKFDDITWDEKIQLAESIEGNVIAEYEKKPASAVLAIGFYAQIEPERKSVPRVFVEILQNAASLPQDLVVAVKTWAAQTRNPVVTGELLQTIDELRIAGKTPSSEIYHVAFLRLKTVEEWTRARAIVANLPDVDRAAIQTAFEAALSARPFEEQKRCVDALQEHAAPPLSQDFTTKFEAVRSMEVLSQKVSLLIRDIDQLREDFERNPKAHAGESFAELKGRVLEVGANAEVQKAIQRLVAVKPDFYSEAELFALVKSLSGADILKHPLWPLIRVHVVACKNATAFAVRVKVAMVSCLPPDIAALKDSADKLKIYSTPELVVDLAQSQPKLEKSYWTWLVDERTAAAIQVLKEISNPAARERFISMMSKSPRRETYKAQMAVMHLTDKEKSLFNNPISNVYAALPPEFKDVFVKIPGKDFYMMKTEVTNAQWVAVMGGQTPSDAGYAGDSQPVVNLSWNMAKAFVKKLNAKMPAGFEIRLPTDEEWLYAARAGKQTGKYWWGNESKDACRYANVADKSYDEDPKKPEKKEIHDCQDGYALTAPVAQFKPNAYGLYDMIGNAWEQIDDNSTDPEVLRRGGAWWSIPEYTKLDAYSKKAKSSQDEGQGLRCVLVSR